MGSTGRGRSNRIETREKGGEIRDKFLQGMLYRVHLKEVNKVMIGDKLTALLFILFL